MVEVTVTVVVGVEEAAMQASVIESQPTWKTVEIVPNVLDLVSLLNAIVKVNLLVNAMSVETLTQVNDVE